MATYRIYKAGITRIDEEYDPENPYGSDSMDAAGRTYYCGSGQNAFSKAVDEAGFDTNVKDTFVFMEEGSWRVPVIYERHFGLCKEQSKNGYAVYLGTATNVRFGYDQPVYRPIPIREDFAREQTGGGPGLGTLGAKYYYGLYPLQRSYKGGSYEKVRYPDMEIPTGMENSVMLDYRFKVGANRIKNMDLLVRPGLEGGKVSIVVRSQTDDTNGFDGIESSYGLNMPGNETGILAPRDYFEWYQWRFSYGLFLPFDRVSGVSFVSGGAGSLASFKKSKTYPVILGRLDATFEKIITYAGWYASPREIDNCTFTGLTLDLSNTEHVTRSTFKSCTSSILSAKEHDVFNYYVEERNRVSYAWTLLGNPRSQDYPDKDQFFTSIGEVATKRFRLVDRCVFDSCTSDAPLVCAALITNCVFIRNTCRSFPVSGFATNCAFVDNSISFGKEIVDSASSSSEDGQVSPDYFGKNSYDPLSGITKYVDAAGQALVTNSYFVRNRLGAAYNPSFMVRNIGTVRDQCVGRTYCLYNCVFDHAVLCAVADIVAFACDEDPTLAGEVDEGGIVHPEKSSSLLLSGRLASKTFPEIDGRLKAQDKYFQGIDAYQGHDLNGEQRQYIDKGCVSIGPVSENIDESFSVVRSSCVYGFGKVYPRVQVCKKSTECTVFVDSYSSVTGVKINGVDSAPSKRIKLVPDERFVDVDVSTQFAVCLSTSADVSAAAARCVADGTDSRPFACLQDAYKYITSRLGGKSPTAMRGPGDEYATALDGSRIHSYFFNVDSRNIEGLTYSLLDQRDIQNICERIDVHVFGGGILDNRPNIYTGSTRGPVRLIKYDGNYDFKNKPVFCYLHDRTDVDYMEEPAAGPKPIYVALTPGSTLASGYIGAGCYVNFDVASVDVAGEDAMHGGSFVNSELDGYDCVVSGTNALACDIDTYRNFYRTNEKHPLFNGVYRTKFQACTLDNGRAAPDGLVTRVSDKFMDGKIDVVVESVQGCRVNGLRVKSIDSSYVTNSENADVSRQYSTRMPVTDSKGNLIGWKTPDVDVYRRSTKLVNIDSYIDRDLPDPSLKKITDDQKNGVVSPAISKDACNILEKMTALDISKLRNGYIDALAFVTLYGYSALSDSGAELIGRYSFFNRTSALASFHMFLFNKMARACGKKKYTQITHVERAAYHSNPRTGAVYTTTIRQQVIGSFEIDLFDVFKDNPGKFVPVSPAGAVPVQLPEEDRISFRTECAQAAVFEHNREDTCLPVFYVDDTLKSVVSSALTTGKTGFRGRLKIATGGRRFYGEYTHSPVGDYAIDSCTYIQSVLEFLNDGRLELEQFVEAATGRACLGVDFDKFEKYIGSR